MMLLVRLVRIATFILGIVQLIWIARYVYEDFGGIIGVVVAWVVFPITLVVSPIYGVLAHGDWLGVFLFAIGPVTYLLLGLLGATRIGDMDPQLGQAPTPQVEPKPSSPQSSAQMPAREPYLDPIDMQIDELAITRAHAAERLRGVREHGRRFSLDTDVWLAADAIWTIVQAAWPDDQTDAFYAARDEAERRLGEGDAELRAAAEAVVTEISDLASTAIRGSAMLGSSHLDFDDQSRADDRAMWQAGGAHHVVNAAVLAYVLGEQLDEAATSLLELPWLALCETNEEDRYDLNDAARENTLDAFRALADDRILLKYPDPPRTPLIQLLEPLYFESLEDSPGDEPEQPSDIWEPDDDEGLDFAFDER